MTMFSAQNLSRQHCYDGGYVSGCGGGGLMNRFQGYDCPSEACGLGSDLVFRPIMAAAEDESATESVNEAGSSSKDVQDDHDKDNNQDWLQLGIGGHTTSQNSKQDQVDDDHHQTSRKGELVELNLLPPGGGGGGGGSSSEHGRVVLAPRFHVPEFQTPSPLTNITSVTHYGYGTSLLFQHQGTSSSFPGQEINWIYRPSMAPLPGPIPIASSPSSSSFISPGAFFARPFQHHGGINIPAPDVDFRVINPPRRPHSGIWFVLQASQNQAKEPFLPQIPKSYLRIKDGRMTIRLVMKYLVNKLRLESESEVEITCRGQPLLPFLTLQHVRDNIWSTSRSDAAVTTLLPDSSTIDHLMVLHYGRAA